VVFCGEFMLVDCRSEGAVLRDSCLSPTSMSRHGKRQ
jgi:hypothetical protein